MTVGWVRDVHDARRSCRCHQNLNGRRPLHAAAFAGQTEVCELLISAGATISAKDEDGKTAEDWARAIGDVALADMLNRWVAEMPPSRGGRSQDGMPDEYSRRLSERGPPMVKTLRARGSVGSRLVL